MPTSAWGCAGGARCDGGEDEAVPARLQET